MSTRTASSIIVTTLVAVLLQGRTSGHVSIRAPGPLSPSGYATVSLTVPNERHVDTVRVVLEVSDAFLLAGGRLSRIDYPPDWKVHIEKADKPGDVYAREAADREARDAARREGATDHTSSTSEAARERELMDQARRKWIKRVTFEGGAIPPDGFKEFRLSLQLPETPGRYRFPARQIYADGTEVAWVQTVEGAERPAAELVIERPWRMWYAWAAAAAVLVLLTVGWAFQRRRSRRAVAPASRS